MLKIKRINTGLIATNTYIIFGEKNAIVVDPGDEGGKIAAELKAGGCDCNIVLLTHGHWDHVNAAAYFQGLGARVYMHRGDLPVLKGNVYAEQKYGISLAPFEPDVLLDGGERLNLNGLTIDVLHTAGHTAGSVCYIIDDVIFSGDTLFYLSVGRTDLPTGSAVMLKSSLKRLFALKKDYTVLPGHDSQTTLFFEKENNPYA